MLLLTILLSFYVAWNLGANDVANSMGTSVGSKAVTLRQALVIAGTFEFLGAVLFGRSVSQKLATTIIDPALFTDTPDVFLLGMFGVLVACGVWLNVATAKGLPVSSSHAVVGAIAGFGLIAAGSASVNWLVLGQISGAWVITPLMSGMVAALFYYGLTAWILDQPQAGQRLQEWIPWLSAGVLTIFGGIILPTLSPYLQSFLDQLGLQLPAHDLPLGLGAIATLGLSYVSLRVFENTPAVLETQMARFQVISACFVAFAHGSNDVGNAIAPLAAILQVQQTGIVPLGTLHIPIWILILGGAGIVAGLGTWGAKVIKTVGEEITTLQPSAGFCAELATAITVLLATRLGLPVSTSHALVGGVIGVGLVRKWKQPDTHVKLQTVQSIVGAWIITIPLTTLLGAIAIKILDWVF
jgi:inorganic phosphate transporter, PiT family